MPRSDRALSGPAALAPGLVRAPRTILADPEWDEAAQRVLTHDAGPLRVIGGPGTGKTTVLMAAVARRLRAGEDPTHTLVLVGSRRAAAELRARIGELVHDTDTDTGDAHGTAREPLVRTVHSYAFGVLRLHAARHSDPPPRLLASAEQDAVVRDLLSGEVDAVVPHSGWPQRLLPALPVPGFAAELRELLLRAGERGLGPDELLALGERFDVAEWRAAGRFYRSYEQVTLLRGAAGRGAPQATAPALDAAELVAAALDALAADPDLLAAERARVRHLVVDDAQDLDPQQLELVRVLSASATTTLLAGDTDQAVLTFRGADPEGMRALDAPTVVLGIDHRGGAAVRTACARLSARLPGAGEGRLRMPPPHLDTADGAVAVRVFTSAAQEAGWIADQLRRAHLLGGVPWSEMAVLSRSARRSLPTLRRALLAAGVPIAAPPDELPLARQPAVVPLLMVLRFATRPAEIDADAATALLTSPLGAADPMRLRRLRRGLLRLQAASSPNDPVPSELDDEPPAVGGGGPRSASDVGGSPGRSGSGVEVGGVAIDDGAALADADPEAVASDGTADEARLVTSGPDVVDHPAAVRRATDHRATGRRDGGTRVPLPPSPAGDSAGETAERVGSDPLLVEALRAAVAGREDPLVALPSADTAPLRRVAALLAIAGRAVREGRSPEEVLWRVWQRCGLAQRWSDASARGGPVGAAADRDLDAVLALFDAAARHTDRLPGADLAGFTEYLIDQAGPESPPGTTLAPATPLGDAVALLTAHAARGREWTVVAVPGVQEGAWPDLRLRGSLLGNERLVDAVAGIADPDSPTVSRIAPVLAEERRLFYVACSRARHTLLVSAVQGEDEQPSRFLDELDPLPAGAAERVAHRPGRSLVLAELVGELRRAVCNAGSPPERQARAATALARLAEAGVPGAHPDEWYGVAPVSSTAPLRAPGTVTPVSPSDVETILRCPLRWVLQRHGGSDVSALSAVTGSLVHALVQAGASGAGDAELEAALSSAWARLDAGAPWYSRRELARVRGMLAAFDGWVRSSRSEGLQLLAVEHPVAVELGGDIGPRLRLRGRVDRLEADAQGRPVVVDVKTGRTALSKQAVAEHPQLAMYQLAAALGAFREVLATDAPGGARLVYVADQRAGGEAKEPAQAPLEPDDVARWTATVLQAGVDASGEQFIAKVGPDCDRCPVRSSCPVNESGRAVPEP